MSDDVIVDDKEYISSKRAAEISGYTQDYIGQLARGGQIDAQRIGGLWFVSMDSLLSYKSKAADFKPQPPASNPQNEPGSMISLDGKNYISAAYAADITGYHQDYVGQLAREGKILSRQVGNRWYVERSEILAHKKEKDALLAAVQTEAVGISRKTQVGAENPESLANIRYNGVGPYLTYTSDSHDLLPSASDNENGLSDVAGISQITESSRARPVYIRVLKDGPADVRAGMSSTESFRNQKLLQDNRIKLPFLLPATAVATIVIILSVGYAWLGEGAIYARINPLSNSAASVIADRAYTAVARVGDILEELLVSELTFKRTNDDFNL